VNWAVVFVNFHCSQDIEARVQAYDSRGIQCVVVDNSGEYSGPGEVVRAGSNIGFGAACNLGVQVLDPSVDVVCLHNPDVHPSVELLADLCRRAQLRDVGVVAPALETPQGTVLNGYSYPRLVPELFSGCRQVHSEGALRGLPNETSATAPSRGSGATSLAISRLRSYGFRRFGSGALLAVDLEAFRQVGGFDERFILYGEDLDLWHRIGKMGYQAHFANDLMAFHERGGGSPASRETREYLRWAGVEFFVQLHSGSTWRAYRGIHRRVLARASGENKIGRVIGDAWARAADPAQTVDILREEFLGGVMEPAAGLNQSVRTPAPSTDLRNDNG
jgi:GT2 family glycosyltransferase